MPPELTSEDRAEARRTAIANRRLRADAKEELGRGVIGLAEVLRLARTDGDRGRAVARLRVDEVLLSLPGVGPVRADGILVAAGVVGSRRLRALGRLQMAALLTEACRDT